MVNISKKVATFIAAAVFVLVTGLLPAAQADTTKKVTLEFKTATQIPGQVLQPGSYVFESAGTQAGWNVVKIYNQDGTSLVSTLLAYQNSQLKNNGEQILFYPRHAGIAHPVMEGWFFDGDTAAQQWAYSDRMAVKIGEANHTRIPTTGTEDVYPSNLPNAASSWTPPVTPAADQPLPQTASNLPMLALVGVSFLLAAFLLRRLTTKVSRA